MVQVAARLLRGPTFEKRAANISAAIGTRPGQEKEMELKRWVKGKCRGAEGADPFGGGWFPDLPTAPEGGGMEPLVSVGFVETGGRTTISVSPPVTRIDGGFCNIKRLSTWRSV